MRRKGTGDAPITCVKGAYWLTRQGRPHFKLLLLYSTPSSYCGKLKSRDLSQTRGRTVSNKDTIELSIPCAGTKTVIVIYLTKTQ